LTRNELSADVVLSRINKVSQLKRDLTLADSLTIYVSTLHDAIGSGVSRLEQLINDKKSIIQIRNADHSCFQRAFIIGKAHADYLEIKKKYDNRFENITQLQVEQAYNVYKNYRIQKYSSLDVEVHQLSEIFQIENRPCGIEDIRNIQQHYPEYQMCVMEAGYFQWIFIGEQESEKKIYILYRDNNDMKHFELITSMPAFFNKKFFCKKCMIPYQNNEKHPCNHYCRMFRDRSCQPDFENSVKCNQCELTCRNKKCYTTHIQENVEQLNAAKNAIDTK
jgi:hypothetical protein